MSRDQTKPGNEVVVLDRQRKHRVDRDGLRRAAEAILEACGLADAELTVTLVSDRRMRVLNRDYRHVDRATDVLSFAQRGGEPLPTIPGHPEILGDVVLSTETAARQAGAHAPPTATAEEALHRELVFLLLHGTLHLLGHTHDTAESAARLERETERIRTELQKGL